MRHKQTGTILAVKVSQGQSKKAGKGTRYMSLVILPTLFIFDIAEDPRHSEHSGAEKAAHGPRHYHAFVRLLEIPNFQKHRFWNDLHARNPKNEELYSSISMRGHLRDRALSLLRPSVPLILLHSFSQPTANKKPHRHTFRTLIPIQYPFF